CRKPGRWQSETIAKYRRPGKSVSTGSEYAVCTGCRTRKRCVASEMDWRKHHRSPCQRGRPFHTIPFSLRQYRGRQGSIVEEVEGRGRRRGGSGRRRVGGKKRGMGSRIGHRKYLVEWATSRPHNSHGAPAVNDEHLPGDKRVSRGKENDRVGDVIGRRGPAH